MTTQHTSDELVAAYVDYLTKSAEPLPAERRTELLAEVRSHIAEARAAGADSPDEIRRVLRQLGDPDEIVASATDGLRLVDRDRTRLRGKEILAIALLALGGFFVFVGWIAGAVLLWTSNRWTTREKWLGTLIWPGGLVFVLFIVTGQFGFVLPVWLGLPVAILVGLAPFVVWAMLIKNARPERATHSA
ncbi:hypothetical protein AB0E69_37425 [Kribbella sp. NPDC026611]|uniref:HAAS signaling domain-containing protein n=1 Tax=Kribbella sp. NPDC026611 TaxID=3154911 RepID=UPI0033D44CF0